MTHVAKVTTKGQITLPSDIRRKLCIGKDNYVAVDVIGDYIIMKKVALKLKEISNIINKSAKKKGITRADIEKTILESREEVWNE